VSSAWEKTDGQFKLRVTIPANATATVHVPAVNVKAVTESGQPVGRAPGVKFLRMEGNAAVFAVGSGNYEFASRLIPKRDADETEKRVGVHHNHGRLGMLFAQ
jgi:alpha-L-rhamnosidase